MKVVNSSLHTITLRNCKDFQMRYCAFMFIKELQNWKRSKKDVKSGQAHNEDKKKRIGSKFFVDLKIWPLAVL